MVCLQIAHAVPEENGRRYQEMWLIHLAKNHNVTVYCTSTEWEQVLQSCGHVKECGLVAFMAQKAQDAHESRHIVPVHFIKVVSGA